MSKLFEALSNLSWSTSRELQITPSRISGLRDTTKQRLRNFAITRLSTGSTGTFSCSSSHTRIVPWSAVLMIQHHSAWRFWDIIPLKTCNCSSALPIDAKHRIQYHQFRRRALYQVAMIREKTDRELTTEHGLYKDHYDHHVCPQGSFMAETLVYIYRPPLPGTSAYRLATELCPKLQPRKRNDTASCPQRLGYRPGRNSQQRTVWSGITCIKIRDRHVHHEHKGFKQVQLLRGAAWKTPRNRFAHKFWWGQVTNHFQTLKATEVEPKQIGVYTKRPSKNSSFGGEYTTDYIVCHVRKGANTHFVIW